MRLVESKNIHLDVKRVQNFMENWRMDTVGIEPTTSCMQTNMQSRRATTVPRAHRKIVNTYNFIGLLGTITFFWDIRRALNDHNTSKPSKSSSKPENQSK